MGRFDSPTAWDVLRKQAEADMRIRQISLLLQAEVNVMLAKMMASGILGDESNDKS